MSTKISEIMTGDVTVIGPDDNLQRAAQMMRDWNVGALPVCDGRKLRGMITDRDITIRASAEGRDPQQCRVDEVMSGDVRWCFDDQTVDEVLLEMGDAQVRRLPVVNRNLELTGMVSLGDAATRTGASVEGALEEISEPGVPNKPTADEARHRGAAPDQGNGRF
ncbi:CBS domain-containing protein [Noviherbaspirillum aridicola]|uniref:CBS domain-containing protein n=1 Tax=Noviherbaspirillum aridicola TaxID=2849687 RepID=A0ABQ4Q3A7_9BURK|nr:CBS domain-containing protein [Noviherbaspirillum aridicola]GIZ51629.1 CBS domain-containing protein [Noviherbaspirillum aridicola]